MEILNDHWIGGRWVAGSGSRLLPVTDPTTERVFAHVTAAGEGDLDSAVATARQALATWRKTDGPTRSALLRRVAAGLGGRAELFAGLLAQEIGCPLWFSQALQVPMPVCNLAAMADAVAAAMADETAGTSVIWREPIGVVAAITPWNAPLHQIIAKVGGALAAGCTVVLKPSELAPLTARALADVFEAAEMPAGLVNMVFGDGETGRRLVEHPGINMVSFTGSVAAGRAVGETAGRAIKKVSLELGGKSAALLLRDAPLEQAVRTVLGLCFANSGQVCVAQSRLLVAAEDQGVVDALCRRFSAEWHTGNPLDPATKLGPLASSAGRDHARDMMTAAMDDGARLVCGGPGQPEGLPYGYFVQPTVFADVGPDTRLAQTEVFGPVLAIQAYRNLDEAIEIANGTGFGLSGGIWSADRCRAIDVARQLRTGQVSYNGAPQNFATPFGGCGLSGMGRENGRFGIEEFQQYKAVHGAVSAL